MAEIAVGRVLSGQREISRATIVEHAARAATGFAALGIRAGDAVAVMLRNDFPFFEASFAAQRIGAYCVPVNWHGKAPEIAYVLQDCGAKAVVAHADLLPLLAPAVPPGVPVLVVPTPPEIAAAYGIGDALCRPPAGAILWQDWLSPFAPMPEGPPGAISSMIYTSGTTGNPKGVRRLNMGAAAAQAMGLLARNVMGIVPGEVMRTVITGPLYHAAPNFYGLYAVRDGGLAILQPRFDAEELLRLVPPEPPPPPHLQPTRFVGLPRLPDEVKRRYDLSSLKWVVHAAAPCSAAVKRAMIEWWGPVIVEYYGATETGAVTFHNSAEALAKPGTVGRRQPGGRVRIYEPASRVLPAVAAR